MTKIDSPRIRKVQSTLYDVCRQSGVSTATVSRVFSGSAKVSDDARKRVLKAAAELDYTPSHAARSLAARCSNTLGVIFPAIASGFYADVLAGIDEVAAEHGFDVLAAFRGGERRKPAELIQRLVGQGRVDGLLLMHTEAAAPLPEDVVGRLPILFIDRRIDGMDLPTIGVDNMGGAAAMIEHLYEQGHRRIAMVAGPRGTFDAEQRMLGCQQSMKRLGLTLDPGLVWQGDFTLASGGRVAREFLKKALPLPDAIFCLNDVMAIGLMSELHRMGISVPEDVAVAGFDDIDAAEHLSLTSIASPMRLMGQVSAWSVIEMITRGSKPADQCLQVRLVVRRSSGAPRTRGAGAAL